MQRDAEIYRIAGLSAAVFDLRRVELAIVEALKREPLLLVREESLPLARAYLQERQ